MKKIITFSTLAFLVGFFVSSFSFKIISQDESSKEIHQNRGEYNLISPLLECSDGENFQNKKIITLKENVTKELAEKEREGKIKTGAVYFRDLNNGPWFGINEKEMFTPASLLKVPVLIAYLKEAETDPGVLGEEIKIRRENLSNESNVPSLMKIKAENNYSIEELLTRMIMYSDNDSFNSLVGNIDFEKIKKVNEDLSLPTPDESTPEDYISVKEYAGLFRILYNSSYLNNEMSEKALEILSKAKYEKGLSAKIPKEITVAHKYGIRKTPGSEESQLHDCGIIYDKKNPYLLCVMTKGEDIEKLSETIMGISEIVYEAIN